MDSQFIVTGGEKGLGEELLKRCPEGWNPVNVPRGVMRGGPDFLGDWIRDNTFADGRMIWINNFGTNHLSWIGETPPEDYAIIDYNVKMVYAAINSLVHYRCDPVKVINVASATYRIPQRMSTLYCASKAAVVQMTKVMARELAPKGWQINSVSPGAIEDTDMLRMVWDQLVEDRGWTKEEADKYALGMIPAGRYTNRSEVADAIMKMIDMPFYVNGTNLEIMGAV